VVLLDQTGATLRTIETGGRPTGVAAARAAIPGGGGGGPVRIGVVDATQSTLTVYRSDTGVREEALRAGDGATNVVGDETGRFYVTDTRDNELLVFSSGPLVLRQRHPAGAAPYGVAYQKTSRTIWVTSTARNEVVGFDVTGGSPREVARHATARQPDAVAVDPAGGTLALVGRVEGVVQVIGA
jgi:DNA-binding beta-propeller fold protein YncE